MKMTIFLVWCSAIAACAQVAPRAKAGVDWTVLEGQALQRVPANCPLRGELPSGVPGGVLVRTIIGTDGTVRKATAYAGSSQLFAAAVEAISKWKFAPQMINGEPAEVYTMAKIEVCKEARSNQQDFPRLREVRRLTELCQDEGNDDAEKDCAQAVALAADVPKDDAVLAHWWADAAYGDLKMRQRKFVEAEQIYSESLQWFKGQQLTDGMQLDLLWRLAVLATLQEKHENALNTYQEAEAIMQRNLAQLEQERETMPEASFTEVRSAQQRHLKRALAGELGALVALKRDAEADAIRVRLAKLD